MRMYDLIVKKRDGHALSKAEMEFMIEEYVTGAIPDYQMSAMLMAIYFNGMNDEELAILTDCMARSGDMMDLSTIEGLKVDKHSTGGVGDKTSLIVAPIVAACGGRVAKMSGRGLGHTGGTVDKLESIPGMKMALPKEKFFEIVNRCGLSIIGQTGNLAPADKKLYALRDVTGTVASIPLIAASIMSKKLAAGSDCILLDVKTGSGAFMKTLEDSILLAQKMVAIGEANGRKTSALITNMDTPLGYAIGNSLEIIEAVEVLQNHGPADLREVCLHLSANMLYLIGKGSLRACRTMAENALKAGTAFHKFVEMTAAQGGDTSVLFDTKKFAQAPYVHKIIADKEGYLIHMDSEKCGIASVILGAGRETKDSMIDAAAGIVLQKKVGEAVRYGDVLARLYTAKQEVIREAEALFKDALTIRSDKPQEERLVFARVEKNKVDIFD